MEIRGMHAGSPGNPAVMGILNVTPDSFSDGGMYFNSPQKAAAAALQMKADGAGIIDIGGESSKPGSKPLNSNEEISRVIPVIKEIRKLDKDILLSVDTYKSDVASAALSEGADIINDIYAGMYDPEIMKLAAAKGAVYVMMHMKGTPENMQDNPVYGPRGAVAEIIEFFQERINAAFTAGIDKSKLVIDPGIGFGKTYEDNIDIMKRLEEFTSLGLPVLAGVSRKSVIGKILGGAPPEKRIFGTAAAVAASVCAGVSVVRVHDVREMTQVVKTAAALRPCGGKKGAA